MKNPQANQKLTGFAFMPSRLNLIYCACGHLSRGSSMKRSLLGISHVAYGLAHEPDPFMLWIDYNYDSTFYSDSVVSSLLIKPSLLWVSSEKKLVVMHSAMFVFPSSWEILENSCGQMEMDVKCATEPVIYVELQVSHAEICGKLETHGVEWKPMETSRPFAKDFALIYDQDLIYLHMFRYDEKSTFGKKYCKE